MYKVKDMAHIGCSVENLQSTIDFFKEVLHIENIRTQYIEFPYLSGVVGIEKCAIDIGFAKKDENDRVIEILDYNPCNKIEFVNDNNTQGSGIISYTIEDFESVYKLCRSKNVHIEKNISCMNNGMYKGKKYFVVYINKILFELIENTKTSLVKVRYVVENLEKAINFFALLSFYTVKTTMDTAFLKSGKDSLIIELFQPKTIKLRLGMSNMVGNVHSCFQVEGIEELYHTLIKNQAVKQGEITYITNGINTGAYAVYLKGIDGIIIELFQGKQTEV